MDGYLDRTFAHGEVFSNLPQRRRSRLARQKDLEGLEEPQLARGLMLVPEGRQRTVEQCQGPAALEDPLGGPIMRRFPLVLRFTRIEIERERSSSTAALLGSSFFLLLPDETSHRGQQEGAEAAALGIGVSQVPFFQQGGKKLLR